MSTIDDGGCITPDMMSQRPQPDNTVIEDRIMMIGGLSIRDYFAAAALTGYFAAPHTPHICDCKKVAKYAYEMADAMIVARKGGA